MKKLNNLPNGGFRLFSDDFRFLQQADKEALEMAIKPVSEQHEVVILFGCEITSAGGNTTVSEGAVIKNGEVMRFDQQVFPDPVNPNFAYWITDDVILKTRAFQNGTTNPIYREKVAKIEVSDTLPSNSMKITETPRFFEVITSSLTRPEWRELPESSNFYPSVGPAARYLKDNSGMVHLGGFFSHEDPSDDSPIGRLPEGFRPADIIEVLNIYRSNTSTAHFHRYQIKPDGYISPLDGVGQVVNFNNWPPFKALEV